MEPHSGAVFTIRRLSSDVNRLEPVDESRRRWRPPRHARIVVYEREKGNRGLLTVYDCGAAHELSMTKLLGTLESSLSPPRSSRPPPAAS